MKDIIVSLPKNTMECEILRRTGFPMVFTGEEVASLVGQFSAHLRLSNNSDYPVLYRDIVNGVISVVPIVNAFGELRFDPKSKIKDIIEVNVKNSNMARKGDWVAIYKEIPDNLKLQVFVENFHKIPVIKVSEVFDFVISNLDVTIDELPGHVANYIHIAEDEAEELTNTVIRKLQKLRDEHDLDRDITFCYEDREFLEKHEEEWMRMQDEKEIEIIE